VTDVVFIIIIPNHTVNAALFRGGAIPHHLAVYVGDRWIEPRRRRWPNSGPRSGC